MTAGAGVGADGVFFMPEQVFFDYLEKICPQKQVVDVGSGMGFLSMLLAQRGYKVLAIDIYPREDAYYEAASFDATEIQFPANCLPLLCRPCHGGWPEVVIEHALLTTTSVLYVGLRENVISDIGIFYNKYRIEETNFPVGNDGEIAVLITKNNS